VLIVAVVLSLEAVLVPQGWASPGDEYLEITGGELLWCQLTSGEDPETYAYVVDDLDGDGMQDVLVETLAGPGADRTGTVIAKRGYDGYHLWAENISGYNAYMWGYGVDDLDGDGKADVLVGTLVGQKGAETGTVIAKKGIDGTHILEAESDQEIWFAYQEDESYNYDYDLDGNGQPDLVICTNNRVCAVAPPSCEVPPPVGGEAYPTSKLSLLAPWIAAGVCLGGGISWYVLRRRRAQS
jgi:hypothetical protein